MIATKKTTRKKVSSSTLKAPSSLRKDLPVTFGYVSEVRKELKSEINGVRYEISEFRHEMNARFAQVDARFAQVDGQFSQINAQLEKLKSTVARSNALSEEQNSRHALMLEAITSFIEDQKRQDVRIDLVERDLRVISFSPGIK